MEKSYLIGFYNTSYTKIFLQRQMLTHVPIHKDKAKRNDSSSGLDGRSPLVTEVCDVIIN